MNNVSTTTAPDKNRQATLLFVDDEDNILSSLRRLFRPLGYNLLIANSGKEGLELLNKNDVDLVVSDMRMPEMDGAEFLAKAAQQWPDTIRILLTGYADIASTIAAVNEGKIYKYISKPWEDNDIKLNVQHALEQKFLVQERDQLLKLTEQQNENLKDLNNNLEGKVKERTEELRQAMGQLKVTHDTLKKSYTASVKVFSSLIEVRHRPSSGHAQRVADLAYKLAVKLGLQRTESQDVLFAALLHDIGKIALPDKLLNSPSQTLDQAERLELNKHPVVGQAVLMSLEPLQEAANVIRSHHEHYDGNGYPDALKGKDIPLGARILSVASDYDSFQLGSEWTQRMSASEAREFIARHKGSRYDPEIVDAFLVLEGGLLEISAEEKEVCLRSNDLESGMVLARNLYTKDDVLLLSKGHVVEDNIILKIQNFEKSLGHKFQLYIQV